jgi:hypothetical protein
LLTAQEANKFVEEREKELEENNKKYYSLESMLKEIEQHSKFGEKYRIYSSRINDKYSHYNNIQGLTKLGYRIKFRKLTFWEKLFGTEYKTFKVEW